MLEESASADELAGMILQTFRKEEKSLPLLGNIPSELGRVEVAVTALGDFERCEMLYRWRYELRAPGRWRGDSAKAQTSAIDAATMGTLFHRCMELLDFNNPREAAGLVAQTIEEMELSEIADQDAISKELEEMLAQFRSQKLWGELTAARETFRELDFVMQISSAKLRGQIDLMYRDSSGAYHIVDYKSDRVDAADVAGQGRKYELQMLVYASAAAKYFDAPIADAKLYFLRNTQVHRIEITPSALSDAEKRIADLTARLISARRSRQFKRNNTAECENCPYASLCHPKENRR